MKILIILLSIVMMISCADDTIDKDKDNSGVGKVNIKVNYSGEQALKRVMVAFYVGDTNKIPDELKILPENVDGELTFPYTFSITPKKNRKYNVTLLADIETSGAPSHTTSAASEYKEITVVKDGVDVEFTLVDPSKTSCEPVCDDWKDCVKGSCELKMGSCEMDSDCPVNGKTCNVENHKCD